MKRLSSGGGSGGGGDGGGSGDRSYILLINTFFSTFVFKTFFFSTS